MTMFLVLFGLALACFLLVGHLAPQEDEESQMICGMLRAAGYVLAASSGLVGAVLLGEWLWQSFAGP
jgi:hypothetical protein